MATKKKVVITNNPFTTCAISYLLDNLKQGNEYERVAKLILGLINGFLEGNDKVQVKIAYGKKTCIIKIGNVGVIRVDSKHLPYLLGMLVLLEAMGKKDNPNYSHP
jgi:hypothetical protein